TRAPARFDAHVAAIGPTRCLQCLQKCREARLSFRIGRREVHEHADPPYALTLLRARRERPRDRRAAEQRDELASSQGWHGLSPPRAAVSCTLSLARRDRSVLGTT